MQSFTVLKILNQFENFNLCLISLTIAIMKNINTQPTYYYINLSLKNQSLSFFRSGSGSSSGLTASSTNASSSEFSCDTVVYRGQSDGSGTDSEHPPTNMLLRTSRNGSLDEIPRPASSNGGRRRKILTNGAISPRQCLSPLPYLPRY